MKHTNLSFVNLIRKHNALSLHVHVKNMLQRTFVAFDNIFHL